MLSRLRTCHRQYQYFTYDLKLDTGAWFSIPMVAKWASEYKDPGSKPLINLSQGAPGEQPHPSLIERLTKVVQSPGAQKGDTTISGGSDSAAYGNVRGDVAMRIALVEEMKYVYGGQDKLDVDVQVEDVALTAGCNAAFMAAVMVVAERGDEVILPVPWWVVQLARDRCHLHITLC
jgi:aspartate/methionine/tyrosine aminotransferase